VISLVWEITPLCALIHSEPLVHIAVDTAFVRRMASRAQIISSWGKWPRSPCLCAGILRLVNDGTYDLASEISALDYGRLDCLERL